MKYYKIKASSDQKRLHNGMFLIKDELLTQRELERLHVNSNDVTEVNIPKSQIYFFFGARFAS